METQLKKNSQDRVAEINRLFLFTDEDKYFFNQIVDQTAKIFNVPISMISILGADEQRFISKKGISADGTPLSIAFCAHTILNKDVFIVNDAQNHSLFKNNPLVTGDPHVRFYAGVSIISKKNVPLGALCVIDHVARNISPHEIHFLETTSQLLSNVIENRARDIKRKRRLLNIYRKRMVEASKMASLGEMASGIAHEVNNPLSIISAKVYQTKTILKNSDININKANECLSAVDDTVFRIANIVKGLKRFARKSTQDPHSLVTISQIVDETLAFCKHRLLTKSIRLDIQIDEEYLITCNPTGISQVLINLMNNAIDAIKGLDEKWIELKITKVNGRLIISLRDSGKGIPQAIVEKIMNPFFTTKPIGHGTGLGLSISKGIIEDHGGRLFYNQGSPHTEFIIELPETVFPATLMTA